MNGNCEGGRRDCGRGAGAGWGGLGLDWGSVVGAGLRKKRGEARVPGPGTRRGAASASAALSHVIYTISSLISLHVRGSRLQLLPIRLYGSLLLNTSSDLPSIRRLRRCRRRPSPRPRRGLESLAAAAEESLAAAAAAAAAADAETRVSAVELVLLDAC